MRNFKLIITFLLVVMLGISSSLLLVSCGDDVSELFLSTKEAPRATYVQGQELDLSVGKLTYVLNGQESVFPLTAEGVSVSGYNKDQLGEQTVTVSYLEKTTEFKVNVIPRIRAEGFETKYFIKDSFNQSKGKLIVARDDGTTFSVNMNNDKVSLLSFDSTSVGQKTVKVKYAAGASDYECSFNVNVYGIGSITLTTPNKITYQSHETKLDYKGGYLTVKSTDDGGLEKFVDITDDMTSGFDISLATKEHMTTPLKQTITIKYGDQTFTYDISITYSGISVINDFAKLFDGFDWDSEDAVINEEKSKATIDAIKTYYSLSKAQRALISSENTTTLIRATAVVVSLEYRKAFDTYENTIKIGNDLSIRLVASSYEETLVDLEKLKNEDDTLNVYAKILRDILNDFPKTVVAQGKTVEQIVAVHSNDIHDFLVGIFEHLTTLYKSLENIPKDWTDDDLRENENNIKVAINTIKTADYYKEGYAYLYGKILSKWREKDDYIDILYYYYLHVKTDEDKDLSEDMFQKVPLPGIMQNWYEHIANATNEVKWMQVNESGDAYLTDVTGFMYYYRETLKAAQAIKDSGNQLYLDIYEELNIDYVIDYNIRVEGYGYFYQCGPMIDSERFLTLWEKYLDLVHILVTDTLRMDENDAKFKELLNAFSALTPSELYGFLTSLNFQYDDSRGSVPVLEYSNSPKNLFIDMMGQYLYHVLNDECEPVFVEFFKAMEKYALLGAENAKDSTLANFEKAMADVIAKYNALSTENKENFNTYLGTVYNKYLDIYNVCKNGAEDLEDNEAKFEELELVINRFNSVLELFNSKEEGVDKKGTLALLVALYERSKNIYKALLATEDAEIISALSAKTYTVDGEEIALDLAFARVRFVAIYNIMLNYVLNDNNDETYDPRVWDSYSISNADQLLILVLDVLYSGFDGEFAMPDKDDMLAIMASVRDYMKNDIDSIRLFSSIEGDVYYYAVVTKFLTDALSDAGDDVAKKLVAAEKIYRNYLMTDNEEYLDSFKTEMEEIVTLYASLTDADKDYLAAMYDFYVSIYNALTA